MLIMKRLKRKQENLTVKLSTSAHSVDPIRPYSSASQIQNSIDLLGFQPEKYLEILYVFYRLGLKKVFIVCLEGAVVSSS